MVTWIETCGLCRELHEIDCPVCRGRGLLRDPDAARTEWDLCGSCLGSGSIVCPDCAEVRGEQVAAGRTPRLEPALS
ncbi:hypothetical protein [Frateuria defendens]|uniref:hypothetical protein n=1 Tax=Frateuria defendens TaxID=2219559 RepID=UPI00066FF733|nr:hypothetical protein [Frateuria defendens]